jgi:hypothetical protein
MSVPLLVLLAEARGEFIGHSLYFSGSGGMFGLPRFNPSAGSLTEVSFSFNAMFSGSVFLYNPQP